jgi:xylitol oxidase
VITRVTLDLIPAFEMQQDVYDNLPIEMLERHFDEIEDAAYSVSLFTDWRGDSINQLWLKRDVPDGACLPSPDEYFGAKRAKQPRHPVPGMDTHACTDQLGSVGKWLDRLPHFKLDFTPSAGEELQTEYLMPIEHALEAIRAVRGLGDRISPLLQVTEIRTIAADDLWLSPSFQRDSLAIHFTWLKKPEPVLALLPEIEAALAPFSPRPHWGKIASIPREQLEVSFEKLGEFRNLVSQIDPDGKFRNRYLNEKVFGEA